MAIYTGGKSTAIASPRHLTLRYARRAVAAKKQELSTLAVSNDDSSKTDLDAGYEKLNSFWAPGLEAGKAHTINVTQIVDPKNGDLPLKLPGEQEFFVDAPQFSLPENSIYSVYPPPGYSDDHRILPHVVLSDPHLPWERLGDPGAGIDKNARNMTPWLALFCFPQGELRLPPDMLASMFTGTSSQLGKPVKQTSTMAVNMTVTDMLATNDITTPIVLDPEQPKMGDSRGDFIFVQPNTFTNLFSTFDSSNKRIVPSKPNTSQYKFLSHVRNINTAGMAVAGVEDVGVFSIVVANRSGPLDNKLPSTVSVHLVSIEGVTNMKFPITQKYVAMCSLYSWNYTVNPPGMLNVPDAFEAIGRTLGVLRPPDAIITSLQTDKSTKVQKRLADRLTDGYSLVRYRTQTGEMTVAMFRGPFTPTIVAPLATDICSNTGIDRQILDKDIGIMDISYSSAWQIGRTMALGNQAFAAALARLRTAIHTMTMHDIKVAILKSDSDSDFRTHADVLKDMPTMLANLNTIHDPDGADAEAGGTSFLPGGPLKRWHRPQLANGQKPELDLGSEVVAKLYPSYAAAAARKLALSTDQKTIYDETNTPVSTDWMVVLAWVMDRMFLSGVPAHYLISDPSHLENERLRFFYIDPNWVDALVDGALSLSNHKGNDTDRVAIKIALKDYIRTKSEHLTHPPQIPSYGFFLRSDLVTLYPDLKVTTLPTVTSRAPLLRHEIVADGVMLALLDRVPGASDFISLVFTQPPHQQRFAVARDLEAGSIKVDIRRQYTVDQSIRDGDKDQTLALSEIVMQAKDADNLFVWGTTPDELDLHILRLPHFADVQLNTLNDQMGEYTDGTVEKKYFQDDTATSALFALQLNDPFYSLTINLGTDATVALLASLRPPGDMIATDSPRELSLLQPSRVAEITPRPAAPPKSITVEPDHTALAANATFTRLIEPSAAFFQSNLAPHVRAATTTIPSSIFMTSALATRADDAPSNPPIFNCSVYTPSSEDVIIGSGLKQDLIFSVHVDNTQGSILDLVEFDIRIRLGGIDPNRNMLFPAYEETGATMLSNLRFNVLISKPTIQGIPYLLLRLLPRNEKGYIAVPQLNDMSFVLALASVNLFQRASTLVTAETFAQYYNRTAILKDSFLINVVNTNFQ